MEPEEKVDLDMQVIVEPVNISVEESITEPKPKSVRKKYTCNLCGGQYTCLYMHMPVHLGQKRFKCDQCHTEFIHKSSLAMHMKIHAGVRDYKCSMCGKSFFTSRKLKDHTRTHTGEKPYACHICPKSFSLSSGLAAHLQVHSGEKPYICDVCNKGFKLKGQLVRHLRVHSGEKPYECSICNKKFTKSCSLTEHKRRHLGEKPYKCSICDKAYADRSTRNQHVKIHLKQQLQQQLNGHAPSDSLGEHSLAKLIEATVERQFQAPSLHEVSLKESGKVMMEQEKLYEMSADIAIQQGSAYTERFSEELQITKESTNIKVEHGLVEIERLSEEEQQSFEKPREFEQEGSHSEEEWENTEEDVKVEPEEICEIEEESGAFIDVSQEEDGRVMVQQQNLYEMSADVEVQQGSADTEMFSEEQQITKESTNIKVEHGVVKMERLSEEEEQSFEKYREFEHEGSHNEEWENTEEDVKVKLEEVFETEEESGAYIVVSQEDGTFVSESDDTTIYIKEEDPVGLFPTRTLESATGVGHQLPRSSWCPATSSSLTHRSLSVGRMGSSAELLLIALLAKKRRFIERKFHVHPLLSSRMNTGVHHTLFNDLCADEEKFFNYFHMSKPSFEELLSYVREDITGTTTNMRECIKPDEKLAVTLRYLASGDTMTDLHYQYRLGTSTISNIIRQVCKAIWEKVKPVCFPDVTERLWLETAAQFYQKTNFPHCLGALDGKHIRVIKPKNSGSLQNNCKNYFSILLLALCDASYKFMFVDVGAYGKFSDSTVFKESEFFRKLQNQTLNIPAPEELYSGFETPMPFVFVADKTFGLSQHILRPYAGKCLSQKKRIFNYRLSRARRLIECSFGILANKWRIFHRPLNVDPSLAEDIIKVCCVLHNFVLDRDGVRIEDTLTVEGLFDMEPPAGPTSRLACHLRDKFADYFVSDQGALPWQLERI